MKLNLENKIVVITGANGGIGHAICEAFLDEGAQCVALYRGEAAKLNALHESCRKFNLPPSRFLGIQCDFANQSGIDQAIQQIVDRFGRIDVLVNNAGHAIEMPFIGTTEEEWNLMFEANLHVASRLARAVIKPMLHHKAGNIINISSIVSTHLGRGVSGYASSKAALNRLTQILALELGRKGIRVNAVAPGAIETPMSSALMKRAGDIVLERTPLKRTGTPEEVAHSVLFLASESTASFITGHILEVDGGVHL